MGVEVCLNQIANLELLEAIGCSLTEPIGLWFYMLMFLFMGIVLYIKTENAAMMGIFGLLMSGVLTNYAAIQPEAMVIAVIIVVLSISTIIFEVFFRKPNI